MKRVYFLKLFLFNFFIYASFTISFEKNNKITIVSEGKSSYKIIIPDSADNRIGIASGLLKEIIKKSTGADLPVIKESEWDKKQHGIFLGKTETAKKLGIPVEKVRGWSYLNRTVGENIFLVGDDGFFDIKDTKIEHLGTLKAVIAFLESQAGVRFFMPGKYGRYIPELKTLSVDASMNVYWEPIFDYVIGRAPQDRVLAVAFNLFGKSPVLYSYGGHSWYRAVPASKFWKTHPEYFALIGGKRTAKGNHLCISNPEVQKLMLEEMKRVFDLGYKMVELGQTDGYQPCSCEKCIAISSDPGERIWIVHRKLAEEIRKIYPDRKVMIIAYGPTSNPPKTFNSFPDNVVIQMTTYRPEDFAKWKGFNVDKTVYIYNWGQYLVPGFGPKRTPEYVVEQVRLFLKNRVKGIYICGGYKSGQCSWGIEGPSLYAFAKAIENPEVNPDDLLKEYCKAAFEEASAPMYNFFNDMHRRLETYNVFSKPVYSSPDIPSTFRTPEDFYCHIFSPNLLDNMTKNLERAKRIAGKEKTKENLKLVEAEFNYIKSLSSVFHTYRAYRVNPNWELLGLLEKKVREREKLIDSIFEMSFKGTVRPFAGAKKSMVERNGIGAATLAVPFNWDFSLLREKKVLPGTLSKSAVAFKVDKIKLDGQLNEPEWQKGKFEQLEEVSMGPVKNTTRFKVLYDDKAIYFGFICKSDKITEIAKIKPVGKDGRAYYQESIEIMIDPFGTREKHFQMVFNPVPNSTFDAKWHFITDPMDPRYGRFDATWNGKWEYKAKIDINKKQWTSEVRIPYSTLGVETPSAGVIWAINIGRAEWPKGFEKRPPILYLWSPNLEFRSFHDERTFGELVFR